MRFFNTKDAIFYNKDAIFYNEDANFYNAMFYNEDATFDYVFFSLRKRRFFTIRMLLSFFKSHFLQ